jgi:signal transduction histidine kinase
MPFYKGDEGSTGIGLAIVEKLVAVYDGSIRAYSNGGACFEFTLKDR